MTTVSQTNPKPYWAISDDESLMMSQDNSPISESALEIKHIWKSKVDYTLQKGLFFELNSLIGKVCLQSRMYDACGRHPARQESKIMQLICPRLGTKKLLHQRCLPTLVHHKSLPITSPFLFPLPLRSFSTTIHPRCDIIVVPRYKMTLHELREKNLLDLENYRSILFRILYTMSVLQKKYGFMHNDQHVQNILMKPVSESPDEQKIRKYKVNGTCYKVPDLEWIPILWDFEDARCDNVHGLNYNAKTINEPDVPPKWCPYYDVHFLLISLIDVFAISNTGIIPTEVRNWVLSMYPEQAIPWRVQEDALSQKNIKERKLQRAQYESREHIEKLLSGNTLPEAIHDQLQS
ncbi:MAG: hypothetical protein EOP45_05050, partial [Sphingobacteriaceae bacterium]